MKTSPFRTRLTLMTLLVAPFAIGATAIAVSIGRADTALLYVGLPCLLALLVGLLPSDDADGHAMHVFQFVTVSMLLVAAFLHEGALCLLIASPLVYGVAFGTYALVSAFRPTQPSHTRGNRYHAAGIGLVAIAALEGVFPGMRINPEQSVTAERLVAAECSTFETALERGPQFSDDDRGWLLSVAPYPLPTSASHAPDADPFAVGTTWELPMPAGAITTRVSDRTATETGTSIDFAVVEDTARTTRWVTLSDATLAWEQREDGCHADVRINFTRDLDPSFYFGPIIDVFMSAGADAFLAGLD